MQSIYLWLNNHYGFRFICLITLMLYAISHLVIRFFAWRVFKERTFKIKYIFLSFLVACMLCCLSMALIKNYSDWVGQKEIAQTGDGLGAMFSMLFYMAGTPLLVFFSLFVFGYIESRLSMPEIGTDDDGNSVIGES